MIKRDAKGRFIRGSCGFIGNHSDHTKELISLASKGKVPTKKQLKSLEIGKFNRKGSAQTVEAKVKISKNRTGKCVGAKHYLWNGGSSRAYKTGYYSAQFKNWRKEVFERDSYKCLDCGLSGAKTRLNAHHIKGWAQYPEFRFDVSNGKTLCVKCHEKTDNFRRKGMRSNRLINISTIREGVI